MGTLTGRTALVTGGSRGIGAGIARRLGRDGARVAVHYGSDEAGAKNTVAAIEADGGAAFVVQAAFGSPGAAEVLWDAFDRHADGVDVVVNNAAAFISKGIADLDEDEFRVLYAVNVEAPYFVVKHALSRLRDHGRVISLSSLAATVAVPRETAYAMTKGAIQVMTRTLAWDKTFSARGITVNAVSPGLVHTDMTAYLLDHQAGRDMAAAVTAAGRVGEPGDIADVVAFLASDDSRFVTGQVIDASGGAGLGVPG